MVTLANLQGLSSPAVQYTLHMCCCDSYASSPCIALCPFANLHQQWARPFHMARGLPRMAQLLDRKGLAGNGPESRRGKETSWL